MWPQWANIFLCGAAHLWPIFLYLKQYLYPATYCLKHLRPPPYILFLFPVTGSTIWSMVRRNYFYARILFLLIQTCLSVSISIQKAWRNSVNNLMHCTVFIFTKKKKKKGSKRKKEERIQKEEKSKKK